MDGENPYPASGSHAGLEAARQRAREYMAQGRYQEARSICENFQMEATQCPDDHVMLALACGQLGDLSAAETAFRRALMLDNEDARLFFFLGRNLLRQDRLEEARACLRSSLGLDVCIAGELLALAEGFEHHESFVKAHCIYDSILELMPDNLPAALGKARTHERMNGWDEAIACYQSLIDKYSQARVGYDRLSGLLLMLYRYRRAINVLKRALSVFPDDQELRFRLAMAYHGEGCTEEAAACYRKILSANHDHINAMVGLANELILQGNSDQAKSMLEPLVESDPPHIPALLVMTELVPSHVDGEGLIRLLELVLDTETPSQSERSKMQFALARLLDRQKKYDSAFECLKRAHALKSERFDVNGCREKFEKYRQTFAYGYEGWFPSSNATTEMPLFVVGMPRSGTSLVEQILASHSQVFGAGELDEMNAIAAEISGKFSPHASYPECINKIEPEMMDVFAQRYLSAIGPPDNDSVRVVDKMPTNFLHLGLISLLFPHARIIHCRRDPLDTCLSCYFQNFSGMHAYTSELHSLGVFYRCYQELMAHWLNVLSLPILTVDYEDLVSDQEQATRNLLEFSGLTWQDRCLEFFKTDRVVSTASHRQVRRPMYQSSVGRWRHYRRHLAKLQAALEQPMS